jgi:hypothetical protein
VSVCTALVAGDGKNPSRSSALTETGKTECHDQPPYLQSAMIRAGPAAAGLETRGNCWKGEVAMAGPFLRVQEKPPRGYSDVIRGLHRTRAKTLRNTLCTQSSSFDGTPGRALCIAPSFLGGQTACRRWSRVGWPLLSLLPRHRGRFSSQVAVWFVVS